MVTSAVNYVMTYTVSDTETLRKVNLFVWPEPYDGNAEFREDRFSTQDLPVDEGAREIERFLAAASAQSTNDNPAIATAAFDAAARLAALKEKRK